MDAVSAMFNFNVVAFPEAIPIALILFESEMVSAPIRSETYC